MFNLGAGGRVTMQQVSEAVGIESFTTETLNITTTANDQPTGVYDPDHSILIHSITFMPVTACDAGGSNISFGTVADDDAIATAQDISATTVASTQAITLNTTSVDAIYKHGGFPVLPAATVLTWDLTTGTATGTGFFVILFSRVEVYDNG
jgi:hypothetical protein